MIETNLTGGRGWLDAAAAASVHRIDRQLGRLLDINEAGRTWAQQMAFWETYQREGAPIALHPDTPSIHQLGNAIDTDDSDRRALLNENGWSQTVYRWVNGVYTLVEPWHFEYNASRDQHINDPAPAETTPLEDNMKDATLVRWNNQHVFAIGRESVYHVPNPTEHRRAEVFLGKTIEVDNDGLTTALRLAGVHWAAVDAVLRGVGYQDGGKYWSRQIAEGEAIRGGQVSAAKTLADVLATAKALTQ